MESLFLYPNDLYQKVEFDRIVELLVAYCNGTDGAERAANIEFQTDKNALQRLLDEVEQMRATLADRNPFPARSYACISDELKMLAIEDYVLSAEGLNNVRIAMTNMHAIAQFFRLKQGQYPLLYDRVRELSFDETLYAALRRVIDDEGNIRPDASPELGKIRRAIGSKNKELDQKFRGVINNYQSKSMLADTNETLRNGRRVLAVLAEHKRTVRGIIHDESASGRTTYIEPEEVIGINNAIFELYNEEKREIWRILRDVSRLLHPYTAVLKEYYEAIVAFDVIHAKAQLAMRLKCSKPALADVPTIQLLKAMHPVLYLRNLKDKKPTIPFTLTFQQNNRILVLSGPNAGGKSIAMKAVGLLQLMLQAGLLVPVADGSEMGIFTKIMGDIGDSQSLDDDLSTYSSRLLHTKRMLDEADGNTLLLIDEMGSGTDPKMGGAIAETALRELNQKQVWGVVTTHYSNLKLFAYKTKGLLNACMLFDKDALTPTYEMRIGRPGSSFAFEMAIKNGWSEKMLDYARNRAGESETAVDQLLVDLQREKQEIAEKLDHVSVREKHLDQLIKQYEQVFRDLDISRKRLKLNAKEAELQQTTLLNKELEKVIRELQEERNLEKAKGLAARIRVERTEAITEVKDLNEKLYYSEEIATLQEDTVHKGDNVRLRNGGSIGTVKEVRKGEAVVQMGMIAMTIRLRDLEKVDTPLRNPNKGKIIRDTVANTGSFSGQLDVRGMSREEALKMVENYIDEAILSGYETIRIVHGKGTGALRTAIKQTLRKYRAVQNITHPNDNDGGDGVTIVQM